MSLNHLLTAFCVIIGIIDLVLLMRLINVIKKIVKPSVVLLENGEISKIIIRTLTLVLLLIDYILLKKAERLNLINNKIFIVSVILVMLLYIFSVRIAILMPHGIIARKICFEKKDILCCVENNYIKVFHEDKHQYTLLVFKPLKKHIITFILQNKYNVKFET